jgi:hypothetical protein
MSDLKTLKDLQKDLEWNYNTYEGLRQEAIKWVKFMRSDDYSDSIVDGADRSEWCACLTAFFNLTEDEVNK